MSIQRNILSKVNTVEKWGGRQNKVEGDAREKRVERKEKDMVER